MGYPNRREELLKAEIAGDWEKVDFWRNMDPRRDVVTAPDASYRVRYLREGI
jgi:hypothetical protein